MSKTYGGQISPTAPISNFERIKTAKWMQKTIEKVDGNGSLNLKIEETFYSNLLSCY